MSAAQTGASGFSRPRLERLSAVFRSEIERGRLPGAVLLVSRHGSLSLFESLGLQDPQAGSAMSRDSIFRIYSMTKPIVSVAVMMLMEQGRLLLSDPISQYLPEFDDPMLALEKDGQVQLRPATRCATVHDLLRHTAGFSYEFSGNGTVQRMYRERGLNRHIAGRDNAAYCKVLASIPLMDEPGSVGEYSRATDVLGRLIEVLSGQSLGEHLRQHVLGPLGMSSTGFFVPGEHRGRVAEPFEKDPDGAALMPMLAVHERPSMESAGGGLCSTAQDYARFLQCLLNGGEFEGQRLLAAQTVDFMTTDHLGAIPARDSLLEPGEGFGLGFAVRTHLGLTPVPGSVGCFYWSGMAGTSFFVDPAKDMFAVLMIQAPNQRAYYRQLFRNLVYASLLD